MTATSRVRCTRSRQLPLALAVLTVAIVLGLAPSALAQKPTASGAGKQSNAPLLLVSQSTNLNPYNPPWCMSEDDSHWRTWSGSFDGSFTTTEYLCDPAVDYSNGLWWNSGGIGVQAEIYAVGSVTGLSITSPTGDSHQGVLMGSSTSKGVTTYHYGVCYMPPFSVASNTGGMPLRGGTWTITVSGSTKSATYSVNAFMGYVNWQQLYCPASEQNLTQ